MLEQRRRARIEITGHAENQQVDCHGLLPDSRRRHAEKPGMEAQAIG
ncbi:hypothetical protein C791_7248 [Amycolatopsis azurea DSM 43854]|uniref:Uncharacterized protein n=1 Tax=Amycolatopsis azurea DSM 43854 TaxID=1238180 RepID=M2QBH7_9PSEU|nr:hypothetical protein C791_7248 [Amycolatopsis azurea DSM 43854]